MPKTAPLPKQTVEQLQQLEGQTCERDEKLSTPMADKSALDAELTRLRTEIYESPYTDFTPRGVDGVFSSHQVDQLISILDDVRQRAIA